jgi:hypothetical protein
MTATRFGVAMLVAVALLEPVAEITWPCTMGCHWQLAAGAECCQSWELRYGEQWTNEI